MKINKLLLAVSFIFIVSFQLHCKNDFTLNFNNVDIKTFIKFMSEMTHQNYVVDPQVRGNVTVYSQKPVPVEDINEIFLSILGMYGYTVIQKDNISLVIPIPDAKSKSTGINIGQIPKSKIEDFVNQIVVVNNCSASDISSILSPYLTKGGKITVDERTNSLIISDIGSSVAKLMEIMKEIDTPSPPGKEEFRIFKLQNAASEEIAKVLSQVLSRKSSSRVVTRRGSQSKTAIQPTVVASKSTNSIIVYADPDDFSTIEKLIEELDVMTNQVLIEAMIAEVTYNKIKDIGIQWQYADSFLNGKYTGEVKIDFGINSDQGGIVEGLMIGLTKMPLDISNWIKLYATDTNFNILSTPQIMAADNQEATINVSENVPYLKETRFVSGTTSDDTIKSYDYKDVGIILKITPQISQNKYVKLKISQSVTKVIQEKEGGLTTAKREVDTTLIVPNHQTIILGGLIKDEDDEVIHKVPVLGDIPLLGRLFQRKRTESRKTNLLIFITPHIITNFEEAEKIRKEKKAVFDEIKKKQGTKNAS